MSTDVKQFWKLLIDSGLLSLEECKRLNSAFARVPGAAQGNSVTLAEWLIASGVLSRYQAKILLAGKPGPFVFGEYKVFERHEQGRLKGIYKAVHTATGHPVLLNFFPRPVAQDARRWPAIVRQAQAAIALRSDLVARVFELIDAGTYKLVVVEDLAGNSLGDRMAAGRLPPAEACRIVRDLALAAGQYHELGQAHGDIRPANVWLAADGGVKLLGFPLARDPGEASTYQVNAAEPAPRLVAEADYLAPELAAGRRPDAATDVYALGCLLYELLAGQPPFPGGTVADKLTRHAGQAVMTLDNYGMPMPIAQLANYMMAKNPPVRLQSAVEAAGHLAPFVTEAPAARRPAPRSLAAYEQTIAQRAAAAPAINPAAPPAAAPATAAATPPAAGAPFVFTSPKPGAAAALPTPGKPAAKPGSLPTAGAPAPHRAKRKINPLFAALGVVGVLGLGALVAWLAMEPGPAARKPAGSELAKKEIVLEVPEPSDSAEPESAEAEPKKPAPKTKGKPKKPRPAKPATKESAENPEGDDSETPTPRPRQPVRPTFAEIDDDGKTLWNSPTSGDPIQLRYLPGGGQVFLIVRAAELLSSPEGSRIFEALGPAGPLAQEQLHAITGVDTAQIEQLTIAFYPTESGPPRAAFVVRMAQAIPEETLLVQWHNPSPVEHEGKKYFKGPAWAYYLPAEEKGRVFAIMPPAEAEDVLTSDSPPLGKMEKLLAESDEKRQFTLLAAPFPVFTDGLPLFAGELERLAKPLRQFIGDGIQAVMLSFYTGSDFFLELRAFGQADDDAFALAARYRTQLGQVPADIESYIVSLNPQPYGKAILLRFPRMIETMEKYTRIGEDRRQAVLRCYLPASAGHNLVMGAELALFERPGAAQAVASKGPAPKKPVTAAEALKKTVDLSFDRDTLEKSMEYLSKEIEAEIVILGSDLQLEGITRNQSFALNERQKSAGEILRVILKKANLDGKLVYVIKPNDSGKETIFVTTRAAATKRGDTLPPEFAAPEPAKDKS